MLKKIYWLRKTLVKNTGQKKKKKKRAQKYNTLAQINTGSKKYWLNIHQLKIDFLKKNTLAQKKSNGTNKTLPKKNKNWVKNTLAQNRLAQKIHWLKKLLAKNRLAQTW